MQVDLSPVSFKALMNVHHPFGLFVYGLRDPFKRFSTLARIGELVIASWLASTASTSSVLR